MFLLICLYNVSISSKQYCNLHNNGIFTSYILLELQYRQAIYLYWCISFSKPGIKVNRKCTFIHPEYNSISFFSKIKELYTVLVMIHKNDTRTSLQVSLSLSPGHFLSIHVHLLDITVIPASIAHVAIHRQKYNESSQECNKQCIDNLIVKSTML